MKPLSIQLYTVRNDVSDRGLESVVNEIGKIGYSAVEGGPGEGMTSKQFRSIVEGAGMVVSSTWGSVADRDGVERTIDLCGDLGTKYAAGGFWIEETKDLDAIKRTSDLLNEALPRFASAGVEFGLHNHWMEFEDRDGKLAIDRLIELVPNLKLELDIYWATNFGANKAEEMVASHADRVVLMHVKDGSQVRGEAHVAVGSGTLDIPACLKAAHPAWYVVELDECDTSMMVAVRESFEYLAPLL